MPEELKVSERWLHNSKKTWNEILDDTAEKYPDIEAIVFHEERVNYREFKERVIQVAKGLYAMGVRAGHHVGLWMVNRPEWMYARFGIYRLGAVMVPLTTRYKEVDLEYVLRQSDCNFLIMEDNFLGTIDAMSILKTLAPELDAANPGELSLVKFPILKGIVCLSDKRHLGCFSWKELLELSKTVSDEDIKTERPGEICHIMYTSGTTGSPKGAVQGYNNNLACFTMCSELAQINPGDRYLCSVPFFGNIGLFGHSVCVMEGATSVISETFDPEASLDLIDEEKITHGMLVGPMAIMMLAHPNINRYNLESLKWILLGMAPEKTWEDLRKRLGPNCALVNGYGLVEGSGLSTWIPSKGATMEQLRKTVGLPLPYCEVAIMVPETNEQFPVDQEGEICTREKVNGTHFMKGYYKKPELTAETIKGGWLHSGDLGKLREDGYVQITGRVKDMIKVGGFNVAPPEIEDYIMRHPKVAQVSVVGIHDERLWEVPAAFIIPKQGELITAEEIIDFCKEKIANIKIPRHIFFVDDFPLTPQAKVRKFMLKEDAERQLGLKP